MRCIILLLVWSVGLWGCGAGARAPSPTAQGYVVRASAVPNTLFLPSDLVSVEDYPPTGRLLVQVHDARATPVDGVPVTFQFVGSACQGVVTLSAPRAVTVQGRASITLTADSTTGACHMAVRVENVTEELWVVVSSPPDPIDRR